MTKSQASLENKREKKEEVGRRCFGGNWEAGVAMASRWLSWDSLSPTGRLLREEKIFYPPAGKFSRIPPFGEQGDPFLWGL